MKRQAEMHPSMDTEHGLDRDRAGVRLWQEHQTKQQNKKLNQEKVEEELEKSRNQFKQQHGEEFFDWAQKKGLLAATGKDTLRAEDIIKEIEEK